MSDGEKQCRPLACPASSPISHFVLSQTPSFLPCSLSRTVSSVEQGAAVVSEAPGSSDVGDSGGTLDARAAIYMAVSGH